VWGATDRGYLVNRETRGGRPARIVLGDPMQNGEFAARAGRIGYVIAVLHRCSVAEGVTLLIPVAVSSVALLPYSGRGYLVHPLSVGADMERQHG